MDIQKLAKATGGVAVVAQAPKFKLDRKLDADLVKYADRTDSYAFPFKEARKLYQYANAKRDYGNALVKSVSPTLLNTLSRIIRMNEPKGK